MSCEDVVRAAPGPDGHLWFQAVERYGGHSTIRIIACDRAEQDRVRQAMTDMGCEIEGFDRFCLTAVDVPPGVDLSAVQAFLAAGEAADRWHYEESALADSQEAP